MFGIFLSKLYHKLTDHIWVKYHIFMRIINYKEIIHKTIRTNPSLVGKIGLKLLFLPVSLCDSINPALINPFAVIENLINDRWHISSFVFMNIITFESGPNISLDTPSTVNEGPRSESRRSSLASLGGLRVSTLEFCLMKEREGTGILSQRRWCKLIVYSVEGEGGGVWCSPSRISSWITVSSSIPMANN